MTTMPGTITEAQASLDYNLIHANVHDLRSQDLSGRYALTDCGDGILNTGTFEENVEECDFAKDPSGPGTITYPHDTAQATNGATYTQNVDPLTNKY